MRAQALTYNNLRGWSRILLSCTGSISKTILQSSKNSKLSLKHENLRNACGTDYFKREFYHRLAFSIILSGLQVSFSRFHTLS